MVDQAFRPAGGTSDHRSRPIAFSGIVQRQSKNLEARNIKDAQVCLVCRFEPCGGRRHHPEKPVEVRQTPKKSGRSKTRPLSIRTIQTDSAFEGICRASDRSFGWTYGVKGWGDRGIETRTLQGRRKVTRTRHEVSGVFAGNPPASARIGRTGGVYVPTLRTSRIESKRAPAGVLPRANARCEPSSAQAYVFKPLGMARLSDRHSFQTLGARQTLDHATVLACGMGKLCKMADCACGICLPASWVRSWRGIKWRPEKLISIRFKCQQNGSVAQWIERLRPNSGRIGIANLANSRNSRQNSPIPQVLPNSVPNLSAPLFDFVDRR